MKRHSLDNMRTRVSRSVKHESNLIFQPGNPIEPVDDSSMYTNENRTNN